ncbi:nucleoside hydrolase [Paenibacillus sp. HB172176]|uniref:nucleoside hydrolase n=1 Tax=Paenibacillus sp. HB172176 TaxID=2493690 RepID=UPI0014397A81|nr:nucleoside hydrolase [Paenibacillus sp. HB172176]
MTLVQSMREEELIRKLKHPGRKVRIVMDTDTFNEIDDQFAVVYALLSSGHMTVEALYAAPFFNELSESPADGMEKSYKEIEKILQIAGREEIPFYRGSTSYLPAKDQYAESEAARNLVERAMASDSEDPLYVLAIGAITNVASAILMNPDIIHRIVVVWLGGHSLQWPDTREFNLFQDVPAARVMFDSGVPLVLIPCMGVASNLTTSLSEIRDYVRDEGELGKYLHDTYENCAKDHYAYTRVIWDISVVAWLVNPDLCPSILVPSPRVSDDGCWIHDPTRHLIRCVRHIHRDGVFRGMFRKIAGSSRNDED